MRKLIFATLFFGLFVVQVSAQDISLRDVFCQMPDTLTPYLTQNNRLDFIDFMDSNMKAKVQNELGGTSEMTALTSDSISISMSPSMIIDILMFTLDEPTDSLTHVVAFVETFLVDSIHGESKVKYYTPTWRPLLEEPMLSEPQKKRIYHLKLQNILKRDDDLLNKG